MRAHFDFGVPKCEPTLGPDVELSLPSLYACTAPATVRRVKRQYRWRLALLSARARALNAAARAIRREFLEAHPPEGVALKVDCDPYGMY